MKQEQGSHVLNHYVLQHNSEDDGTWWLDLTVSLTCCFGLNNTSMSFNSNKTSSVSLSPVCCYHASIVLATHTHTNTCLAFFWLLQLPNYPYSCTEPSKVIRVISTNLEGMSLPLVICLSDFVMVPTEVIQP